MKLWYWLAFGVYAVAVVFIGWRGYQKSKRAEEGQTDFWAAGKKLGAWSVGLSISASFMSISWSCVYDIQLFYWYGLGALWLLPIPWLLTMAFYYILTPYFRNLPAFSQPEMIARRFGERARSYLAVPLAFVFLVWGGAEIYAAANILAPLLDVSVGATLIIITVIVATYSYMGGFAAVVNTDKLQYALVAFFILSVTVIATKASLAGSSFSHVVANLPAPPKANASAFGLFAAGPALIAMTLVTYLPGWVVETDIWLRLQAAHSHSAARKGILLASINSFFFIALLPMVIGLAALHLYPPIGPEIPAELQDGATIIAVMIRDHAPQILGALLIVGLAAAAMSTIDTCSNVVALSLSYDILEPYLQSKSVKVNLRVISRVMSGGAVFLAYGYALLTESLWDIFYLSSGILTTTIFIPMVALFRPASTKRQVEAAAIAGFLSTFAFYFLEKSSLLAHVEPLWLESTGLGYILFGLAASFLAYLIAGRWLPADAAK
jgi:Na+/proline symporter